LVLEFAPVDRQKLLVRMRLETCANSRCMAPAAHSIVNNYQTDDLTDSLKARDSYIARRTGKGDQPRFTIIGSGS